MNPRGPKNKRQHRLLLLLLRSQSNRRRRMLLLFLSTLEEKAMDRRRHYCLPDRSATAVGIVADVYLLYLMSCYFRKIKISKQLQVAEYSVFVLFGGAWLFAFKPANKPATRQYQKKKSISSKIQKSRCFCLEVDGYAALHFLSVCCVARNTAVARRGETRQHGGTQNKTQQQHHKYCCTHKKNHQPTAARTEIRRNKPREMPCACWARWHTL